jgi:hypothetical protein
MLHSKNQQAFSILPPYVLCLCTADQLVVKKYAEFIKEAIFWWPLLLGDDFWVNQEKCGKSRCE